jgi:glucoamylase
LKKQDAPGRPGIEPRWTSSAKDGVGTALSASSRVWFTISHGILDEIYYPRLDQACTRDLGMLVSDGRNYFSEEKRQTQHEVRWMAPGVPAFQLSNTDEGGRYRIEKVILSDPARDTVLQHTRFIPLKGQLGDYELYVLLAPHLANQGKGNNGWIGDYKGIEMLFAERADHALALASSAPWLGRSAGYVGSSDGWQDLSRHKTMRWEYTRATDGNIALMGRIDLEACGGEFTLALGFGLSPTEAGQRARASLQAGFDSIRTNYVKQWQDWQQTLRPAPRGVNRDLYRASLAVLRIHEAKRFPGGLIASLSIPWGFSKGDEDLGGYHLVWPRDLAESAGGLLAAGAASDARRVLDYLQVTQEADGHWPQNMWIDGRPYWGGLQMDETAFTILLIDLIRREGELSQEELLRYWPTLRDAASFILRNGPVTQQDRWEEDAGYSPFTLAVEVAALLAAADLASTLNEPGLARYLQQTADAWNDGIDRWCYVTDTPLTQELGVEGYYVRIAPPEVAEGSSVREGFVPIKNRPPGESEEPADYLISPDALALVRFGLRSAEDPRILNTIKAIDTLLKVDTPHGSAWYRYNDDGYGEHADGEPFDGTGIGRLWPLLTGERAHYELSAGSRRTAFKLLHTLESFSNAGFLLPEQVWDKADIPERDLTFGHPSGSAMPLVWAHAEYVKLARSLSGDSIFDMPPQPVERYQKQDTHADYALWRFNQKIHSAAPGKKLRIETLSPAVVHWTGDGWHTVHDDPTHDTGLGIHNLDLDLQDLPPGSVVKFTLYWKESKEWEGLDYQVEIEV